MTVGAWSISMRIISVGKKKEAVFPHWPGTQIPFMIRAS